MKSLLIIALIILSMNSYSATEATNLRRISLDTQYLVLSDLETVPTNRAIGNLMIDTFNSTELLYDKLEKLIHADSSAWARVPYFFVVGGGLFSYAGLPLQLAYHEMGHASRLRAFGARPFYKFKSSTDQYTNFFSFALASLGKTEGDATVEPEDTTVFDTTHPDYIYKGSFGELNNPVYLMGGLNNEMNLSELYEDQLYYRKGHVMQIANYVAAKMSTNFYIEDQPLVGDIVNIKAHYTSLNLEVDDDDLNTAGQTSLLLSSSTYAYIYGLYNYIKTGDSSIKHFTYKGFRLPDVSFYYLREGLSYKVTSGYQLENSWILFAIEHIFNGEDITEATLGFRHSFEYKSKKFVSEIKAMVGPSLSSTMEIDMETSKNLWVKLGLSQINNHSLWGQRNINSLEDNEVDYNLWTNLSYYY
jgi:hypothetical protein